MSTCFVIQPFDGGAFDKRYEDTLAPAIKAAGIEPYRVDRDDAVVIPIEDIEKGIRNADVCLADISTDNPNVWFEVGFAIASGKPAILVCSHERVKFPFDVQHRTIIRYKTESRRDFENLAGQITKKLKVAIDTKNEIADISNLSPIANAEGLSEHEMVALVVIAQDLDGPVSSYIVVREMKSAGYTDIAASLAVRSLCRKQYLTAGEGEDQNGNAYAQYSTTDAGFRWLESNQSKLTLRKGQKRIASSTEEEEPIPF